MIRIHPSYYYYASNNALYYNRQRFLCSSTSISSCRNIKLSTSCSSSSLYSSLLCSTTYPISEQNQNQRQQQQQRQHQRPLWNRHHHYYHYSKLMGWHPRQSMSTSTMSFSSSSSLSSLQDDEEQQQEQQQGQYYFNKIKILYASQTGTAQLFAYQLYDTIISDIYHNDSNINNNITINELSDMNPKEIFHTIPNTDDDDDDDRILHIFIVSTSGVGEPPNNGQLFYNQLQQYVSTNTNTLSKSKSFYYTIYALGNLKAHPNNFCSFGKNLYHIISNHNTNEPFIPIVYGDDSGTICLEDSFDQYMNDLIQQIINLQTNHNNINNQIVVEDIKVDNDHHNENNHEASSSSSTTLTAKNDISNHNNILNSNKYPKIHLLDTNENNNDNHMIDIMDQRRILSSHQMSLMYGGGSSSTKTENNNNNIVQLPVLSNHVLNPYNSSISALREITFEISNNHNNNNNQQQDNDNTSNNNPYTMNPYYYETGDHLIVYPCNTDIMVEAYLSIIAPPIIIDENNNNECQIIDPHGLIMISDVETNISNDNNNYVLTTSTTNNRKITNNKAYPHPIGISLYDTLRYCVDLNSSPSPSFTRFILGIDNNQNNNNNNNELNYTDDIAIPRTTILDLLYQSQLKNQSNTNNKKMMISLEDLLYNLSPLKPRYYSIASSSIANPNKIILTYRPVKFINKYGSIKEGLTTSYMSSIGISTSTTTSTTSPITVACAIKSNPSFRLPKSQQILKTIQSKPSIKLSLLPPIVMIAGGCGIAPIRAFLEEIIYQYHLSDINPNKVYYGPVHLFLGFRYPTDSAYNDLINDAYQLGIIQTKEITYSMIGKNHNCLVSDSLQRHSDLLYSLLVTNATTTTSTTTPMTTTPSLSNNDNISSKNSKDHIEDNHNIIYDGHDNHDGGAIFYLCGGARTFGAAVEHSIQQILQQTGQYHENDAIQFIRTMIQKGRLHEDLSN